MKNALVYHHVKKVIHDTNYTGSGSLISSVPVFWFTFVEPGAAPFASKLDFLHLPKS
jgi:hypothetical protein